MPLTADDFRDELYRIMDEAIREGHKYVDVNAGEIHRGLGSYPGARPQGACLLQPSGQGASLTIRYVLPRRDLQL